MSTFQGDALWNTVGAQKRTDNLGNLGCPAHVCAKAKLFLEIAGHKLHRETYASQKSCKL